MDLQCFFYFIACFIAMSTICHLPHTQQTRKQDKEVLGDLFRGRGKGGVDPSTKNRNQFQFQETCLCICCLSNFLCQWSSSANARSPPEVLCTWWLIPLSKWVITPIISGLTLLIPFITGVITHLLSGMSHQVVSFCHWLHSGDVAVYCNSSKQQIAGRERHLSHPTWDVYPLTEF